MSQVDPTVELLRAELARVTAERDAERAEAAALWPTIRWVGAGTFTHGGMNVTYMEGHT